MCVGELVRLGCVGDGCGSIGECLLAGVEAVFTFCDPAPNSPVSRFVFEAISMSKYPSGC